MRRLILGIAAFAFIAGTAIYFNRATRPMPNDFSVFYRLSHRMATGQFTEVYRPQDLMPFRYSPLTLPLFAPLAWFSETTARGIWVILQAGFFLAGFLFLWKSLSGFSGAGSLVFTAGSFLLVLRYYLDSLMCGQVSGLIFCGFSLGLFYAVRGAASAGAVAILLPSCLKVGPGILHLFFLFRAGRKNVGRVIFALILGVVLLQVCTVVFYADFVSQSELWQGWLQILQSDSRHFDGASEKNQALRGLLMRHLGTELYAYSEQLWFRTVVLGVLAISAIWWLRVPKTKEAIAWSYSLGVLAFVLFMPQSLPYSMVHIAIPLALLVRQVVVMPGPVSVVVLGAVILFASVPGSDVVGFETAAWIQKKSLPMFSIFALLFFCGARAWALSGWRIGR